MCPESLQIKALPRHRLRGVIRAARPIAAALLLHSAEQSVSDGPTGL